MSYEGGALFSGLPILRRDGSVRGPHVNAVSSRALEIGKAAEHIVVADLILSGYTAFLTEQGLPYDVVFDCDGLGLLRVQVKSTLGPKQIPQRANTVWAYQFYVRRAGKGAKRIIGNDEFDLLALVALDVKKIAYVVMSDRVLQTIHLHVSGALITSKTKVKDNIDEYPIGRAVSEIGAKRNAP